MEYYKDPFNFIELLQQTSQTDVNVRLEVYGKLEDFLSNENSIIKIDVETFSKFIESLITWISSSNFKVSINALNLIVLLSHRLHDQFRMFVPEGNLFEYSNKNQILSLR